jgi:polysaccharide export outer membrane protein
MKLLRTVFGCGWPATCVAAAIAVLSTGCRTTDEQLFTEPQAAAPTGAAPAGPAAAREQYEFEINDLLTLIFSGVSEPPPVHEERIKEDGTITPPLIGPVKAVGKNPGELQKELWALYVPKYYNSNFTVTVRSERRLFYVDGEVRAPGRPEYMTAMTVTQAITAAGGFTEFANKKKVQLTRVGGKTFIINWAKAQKDKIFDLPVYPGDKIYVPRHW